MRMIDIRIDPHHTGRTVYGPRNKFKRTSLQLARIKVIVMQDQELFDKALSVIGASASLTNHTQVTKSLLIFAATNGMTLQQCTDKRFMNRKLRTLKRYVRRFNLSFPDYTPRKFKKEQST